MHIKIIKGLTYISIIIGIIFSNFLNVYGFNNPYINEINNNTKISIDKLVVSISYKKYQLNTDKFEVFLADITKKLNNLKSKYSNNNEITSIINYLNYELSIINTDEKITEEELEKILCLNGNCKSNSIINSNSDGISYTTSNISSVNFGSCDKSASKFYKSGESCVWANFECKNGKYYWGSQLFSTEPPYPESGTKLYDKYNLCMSSNSLIIKEQNNSNIINEASKECKFNMKPYFDLGLKTTFYFSDKMYEPDSKGNMILPGNMTSDFYAYKGDATNPQIYFKCNNGKLSIYNSNYSLVEPLKGVLSVNNTSLTNNNNIPINNNSTIIISNDSDNGTISNNDIIINQDSKECKFNMKPYFDLGLKTTFYFSDKMYEPDSKGNMILPGNMTSDFYAYKGDATNPQVYFKCNNGKLSIYNNNYSLIEPLKGVLIENEQNSSIINENNTTIIKDIEIICAGNGWPASIEISGNGNFNAFEIKNNVKNKLISISNNYTTNKYIGQISNNVEKINIYPYNSNEIIGTADLKNCTPNNFDPKPEILSANYNTETKTIVVKTKNSFKGDTIDIFDGGSNGSLFWEKDKNGTYTAKLTDPYYQSLISYIKSGKSYVGIYGSFEPNYWRNSVRNTTYPINITTESDFTYSRSYDSKGQWLDWKTSSNVTNLARKSIGPNGIRSNISGSLNLSREFASYEDLEKNGWLKGSYDMNWTITLKDGSTKIFKEYFTIP